MEDYYWWTPEMGVREITGNDAYDFVVCLAGLYPNHIIFSGTGPLDTDAGPITINKIA